MPNYVLPRPPRQGARLFDGCIWIVMKPFEIESQAAYARGDEAIKVKPAAQDDTFEFLAPMQIDEVVDHDWSEYESIATRLAQKAKDIGKLTENVKGIKKAGEGALGGALRGGGITGTARETIAGTIKGLQKTPVYRGKVDSPLVYQNTTRKSYIFNFTFADQGGGLGTKIIYEPIEKLKKYSCAKMVGTLDRFLPPHIFTVTTKPINFIEIKRGALTKVQPTYHGPYRDGYPTRIELQLEFQDIEPLYESSWYKTGIVSTSSTTTVTTDSALRARSKASGGNSGMIPKIGEE